MNQTPEQKSKEFSKKRKIQFKIALAIFPFLLLLIIELLLRTFNYDGSVKLFIKHPNKDYSKFKMVNPAVGKKYFQKFEYTKPAYELFLKKKPDNGYRIFVLGSSTAVGFPYKSNMMFSRILHHRLQDAYPDKKIEVINTAITAINSFTLLDYTHQILKEEADAILIYAGHNEYYGAFGIGSNENTGKNRTLTLTHLKLMNLKLYRLLRNTIFSVSKAVSKTTQKKNKGTLMKRIVNKSEIAYMSEDYITAITQYEKNFDKIITKAKRKDVDVIISEVVSNIKDIEPFVSIESAEHPEAFDIFKMARSEEENGNYKKAKELYEQARDLDGLPFRAPTEINKKIRFLAKKHSIPLVSMLNYFGKRSPHHIMGDNLFTEHVHPNRTGYTLMAEAFYETIVREKIVDNDIDIYNVKTLDYFTNNWGTSKLDEIMAFHSLTLLKSSWPFVKEELEDTSNVIRLFRTSELDTLAFNAMESLEAFCDAHYQLAQEYEESGNYIQAFREYNVRVKANPYNEEYYNDAAKCLIKLSDISEAIKFLKKSLEIKETYFANYHLGSLNIIKHEFSDAIHYLNNALELAGASNQIDVLDKLNAAYTYNNQPSNAEKNLNKILKLNPGYKPSLPPKQYSFYRYTPSSVKSYVDNAKKLISEGKINEAEIVLTKSLKINDSPIANLLLGDIYLTKNEYIKALYFLQKNYTNYRKDPDYMYKLIMINYHTNRKKEAYDFFEEFKLSFPGHGYIKQFERNLSAS